jgi:hypothetical protein
MKRRDNILEAGVCGVNGTLRQECGDAIDLELTPLKLPT